MDIKPYLIVPKLIPQPTWGGQYIANYKGISDPAVTKQNIGQSYELSADTMLSTVTDSKDVPIEIGDPKTGETVSVIGDSSTMFPLKELIAQNPEQIVGKKYVSTYGSEMKILIKFTQAKGNSFQVHVRPGMEFGHWKAKPESWYFMEKGRATLGLKRGIDLDAYKQVCAQIEETVTKLGQQVQAGALSADTARQSIQDFLMTHSPFLSVNVIDVPKDAVIDLSAGGIHHSWEEGDDLPNGNIVYEVQLNVMDNDCTLRSFDKGKIGDDGKIRPVHVEDYFKALDTDPSRNDASKLVQKAGVDGTLFETPFYSSRKVNDLSVKAESFQHVFVEGEDVQIEKLTARHGASVFIPAACDLSSTTNGRFITTHF